MVSAIARYFQKLALVFWLGEMLFFIVIFAPRVFKVLPRVEAAKLQAAIFPAYYNAGILCGAIVLMSMAMLHFSSDRESKEKSSRRLKIKLALASVAFAVFCYSAWVLTPQISELQPLLVGVENPNPEIKEQFNHLHRFSVQLNGGALIALLALLAFL